MNDTLFTASDVYAGDPPPDVVAEIERIEAELRATGVPEPLCRWGHGEGRRDDRSPGLACGNCLSRGQLTFDGELA